MKSMKPNEWKVLIPVHYTKKHLFKKSEITLHLRTAYQDEGKVVSHGYAEIDDTIIQPTITITTDGGFESWFPKRGRKKQQFTRADLQRVVYALALRETQGKTGKAIDLVCSLTNVKDARTVREYAKRPFPSYNAIQPRGALIIHRSVFILYERPKIDNGNFSYTGPVVYWREGMRQLGCLPALTINATFEQAKGGRTKNKASSRQRAGEQKNLILPSGE